MFPVPKAAALVLAALCLVSPTASAACSTAPTGARCILAPQRAGQDADPMVLASASSATPAVAVGEVLQRGRYSILMNADYYGLPPVADGWVYMRVDRDVFRVDWATQQVLERVTDRAASNF